MLTKILTHKDSVISHSGQTRQWTFNIGLKLLSGLLFFSGLIAIIFKNQSSADAGLFLIGPGMLIGFYTVIRLAIIIKCPQCKLRWYWYGMVKDPKRNLNIGWMSHCPRCSYPEDSRTSKSKIK